MKGCFMSLYMIVVLTEVCSVMVNGEKLIGTSE